MSGNTTGNGDEAEFGRSANAHVRHTTNLAALRSRELNRVIDQPNWQNDEEPDFHRRLVERHYSYSGTPGIVKPVKAVASDTSSMAVSIHSYPPSLGSPVASSYASSSRAPSLVQSSTSTVRTHSSARTDRADSVILQRTLEEDEDGTLQLPASPDDEGRLACPLGFLDCEEKFDDWKVWIIHWQAHFKGHLPTFLDCPFECDWTVSSEDSEQAWRQCTVHIISKHLEDEVDTTARPKVRLLDHLRRHHLIDNGRYKELRQPGGAADTQASTRTEGQIRDRRRERR